MKNLMYSALTCVIIITLFIIGLIFTYWDWDVINIIGSFSRGDRAFITIIYLVVVLTIIPIIYA